ncbi:hypothetical protein C5167_026431 [Papaver somniferum]|uniref:probable E3 ubiquitin-protein ligase WAVH2 n=1 Tax=Papaver somniferum TaxID=3469 RepID=UPI000E6FA3D9|nr:probable E3 ubiquitin-protein ligase WAVH2 [Papaver somniferum]RZC85762.1 hypothetical protein C5167_026431 [Papaver somniferum]
MLSELLDDDELIENDFQEEEDPDVELDGGKTEARIVNKQKAPLEKSPFKVLVELKGVGADEGRLGVDLVTILDISRSMKGPKLAKMKLSMQFLIRKLSPVDRLSVVAYSRRAKKLCPLRQITEESQTEIVDLVNDLVANSTTNTEAGLRMALNILKGRKLTKNRTVGIMLMTDGVEDAKSNASRVPVSEVPVYTFGFGRECDQEIYVVLSDIAKKSKGGTFTAVPDLNYLTVPFSTSLAGLLNVSIEDLNLTVTPLNSSELNKVDAGNYPQTEQATVMDPITVTYRSIYDRETRKVLANLTLPKVDKRLGVQIFKVGFRYRVLGKDAFDHDERLINVTRTEEPNEEEIPEVQAEETRINTANSMKEARILAEKEKLEEARKMLEDANISLPEIEDILRAQVEHLHLLMASQETYDKQGRAFALAVESSHETQRAKALPDGIPGLYETPLMAEYKKQAKNFDLDPEGYVIPTAEEDKKATATPPPPPPPQQVDRANKIQEIRDLVTLPAKKVDELE